MTTTIYHNPRCSKSRQALALLEEAGVVPQVRLYLNAPLSRAELLELVEQLQLPVRDVMRRGESVYKELNLVEANEEALLSAIVEHPILLERPIVVTPKGAMIARPPERVQHLLS